MDDQRTDRAGSGILRSDRSTELILSVCLFIGSLMIAVLFLGCLSDNNSVNRALRSEWLPIAVAINCAVMITSPFVALYAWLVHNLQENNFPTT